MLKVGLTGGIGTGKSTVSSILREKNIAVIDADAISREIYSLYPEVVGEVKKSFGDGFFDENGELRRRELGNFIFRYAEERKKLENIVIPYIRKEIFNRLESYNKKGEAITIVDAPTLIENGLHTEMDFNILVWVDKATQIARIKKRDMLTNEQIAQRINAQLSIDYKKEFVDFIIDNSSDLLSTRKQVENIVDILRAYTK